MDKPSSRRDRVEPLVVLRAQLGDRDALAEIHRRYHRRLLYYLRRLLGPGPEGEDVLQEVWVAVIRKVATLERPETFRAWVYRIAHNRAISRLRKVSRTVSLEEAPEAGEIESQGPGGSEELFARHDAAVLQAALEKLSVVHREVLTLRFLEELSYHEIATITETSLGTVRSRLHYAKQTLHGILAAAAELPLNRETR